VFLALFGLGLVVVLALAAAEIWVLAELQGRGLRWDAVERGLTGRTFVGLSLDGRTAESVHWDARTPRRVDVEGLDLRLGPGGGAPSTAGISLPAGLELHLSEVTVGLGDLQLGGLSGVRIGSSLSLQGEGARFLAPGPAGEDVWLELQQVVDHEHVSATVRIEARKLAGELRAWVTTDDLVVRHPVLSRRPLRIGHAELDVSVTRAGDGEGTMTLGDLTVDVSADCDSLPPERCTLSGRLEPQPAAAVYALFAPIVPELATATVQGRIGGEATVRWPELLWSLDPVIEDLAVEGAALNVEQLRYGRFEYLVRGVDGEQTVRASGEGTRGWTRRQSVHPSVEKAIMAAEDSAFLRHRGYHVEAMREALAESTEAGELGRGGSTLTQQLVKNLYLSGDRTIERKLRELLLAVELDRVLGKSRVMELYLNVVEWGPDIYGVADASEYYFLKRPANLNPNEAAFLAAILPAPRTYHDSWYLRGRAGSVRIDWILQNMADGGWISRYDASRWARKTIRFVPPP